MPHKKDHSPFDLSNMFANDEKGFGFTIESSFVQGTSDTQKRLSKRKKKYADVRYKAVKSGSAEPNSSTEVYYADFNRNIYGQSRS